MAYCFNKSRFKSYDTVYHDILLGCVKLMFMTNINCVASCTLTNRECAKWYVIRVMCEHLRLRVF